MNPWATAIVLYAYWVKCPIVDIKGSIFVMTINQLASWMINHHEPWKLASWNLERKWVSTISTNTNIATMPFSRAMAVASQDMMMLLRLSLHPRSLGFGINTSLMALADIPMAVGSVGISFAVVIETWSLSITTVGQIHHVEPASILGIATIVNSWCWILDMSWLIIASSADQPTTEFFSTSCTWVQRIFFILFW